ncbi:sensor histidine kinase [Roseibium sp.]|uniref:sensor histidine kinase n=1 Tax=Roseibium sp. TaxID=1936156 RepID=UPI003A96CFA7
MRRRLAFRLRLFAIAIVLAASLAIVWLTGATSLRFFLGDVQTRAEASLQVQSAVLEGLLDKFRLMAPLVARSPDAVHIVASADQFTGRQVAALAAGMAGAEEVWFLADDGSAIASSNTTGLSVALRGASAIPQAFTQALQGQLGRELLRGTPEAPANYVFASPVRVDGVIAGVLAVRVSLAGVEQAWALSKDPIIAADEAGEVLVSNIPSWRGRNVREVETDREIQLVLEEGDPANFVQLADRRQTHSRMELTTSLPVLGWKVLIFADTTEARRQSARAMVIALLLCVIAGGAVWAMLARREELTRRLRRDKAAALRLERRVRSRTTELRKANARLEQEVRDREQAEADLRQAQAELVQAAKLATLGKMSAALSHEYNQPLAAIRSDAEIAEMLIARGTPDKALANLGRIGEMVARMAEIARTLKGFSRRSGTEIKPVSLRQVIDEAMLMLMPQIKRSGVTLTTSIPDEDIIVSGGRIRLEQVVMNLVSNAVDAVKAVSDPRITLDLRLEGGFAVLSVRDNGPGIDPQVMSQIFEPFFTTKEVGAGLGLGLSIAYKIVHDFSGTLSASNDEAGGALFVMRLPEAGRQTLAAE